MKKKRTTVRKAGLIAIATIFLVWIVAPAQLWAQENTDGPETGNYVAVNSLNYYYEIHEPEDLAADTSAQAKPLLLLHGGLGSTDMLDPILPILTKNRKVIGVDLHGHGRTALGDRPISYTDMGDDMAALLKEIGYDRVDVMGYSMGGGVALRLAIQHPGLVQRLVVVSSGFSHPDEVYPELIPQQKQVGAEMAESMKGTPMYESYKAVAPHPEDFPKLLDRMGDLMSRSFDWSEEIKELEIPVMLVYGDSDMIRPEHIVDFYQLLGGGLKDAGWQREHMSQNRLAILPGLTHYDIFMSPELARTARSFLNEKSNKKSWKQQVEKDSKH